MTKVERRIVPHYNGQVVIEIRRTEDGKKKITEIYPGNIKTTREVNEVYILPWGKVLILDRGYYLEAFEQNANYYNLFDGITPYIENNRIGLKYNDGEIALPPILDQFDRIGDAIFFRRNYSFSLLRPSGTSVITNWLDEDKHFFVENGRFGWIHDGHVIIPAQYLNIDKWPGYDVYCAETDSGCTVYFDSDGNQILPYHDDDCRSASRDSLFNNDSPFGLQCGNNDSITCVSLLPERIEGDAHCVRSGGHWVHVDTISGDYVRAEMLSNTQQFTCKKQVLKLFDNMFSYEFSAYRASAGEDNAVVDCLSQLETLGAHDTSWHYLLKVWSSPESPLQPEDIRTIRQHFEDLERGVLSLGVSAGFDEKLNAKEVRMLLVTHFHDSGPVFTSGFDWIEFVRNCTVEELRDELIKRLGTTVGPKVKRALKYSIINICQAHWRGNTPRGWTETKKLLNYLKEWDETWKDQLGTAMCGFSLTSTFSAQYDTIKDFEFHYRKAKWMVNNGALLNMIKDGSTHLDRVMALLNYMKDEKENVPKRVIEMQEHYKDFLIQHGAKTKSQLRGEARKGTLNLKDEISRLRNI